MPVGATDRIIPQRSRNGSRYRRPAPLVALTEGSTKPTSLVVTNAGIAVVEQFDLRTPVGIVRRAKGNSGSNFGLLPKVPGTLAVLPKNRHVHFCTFGRERNARLLHGISGAGIPGEKAVIGKQYFVRQAAILFGIAKATKDPKMSAALMDKAADVKSKVDELGAPLDLTPLAPDIEPPLAK